MKKQKILEEIVNKYRGEEAERMTVLPLLEWLSENGATNRDAVVIVGQRCTFEIVEKCISQEISEIPDGIDKDIVVVEKVAEAVGKVIDMTSIENEVKDIMIEYVGQLGTQSVGEMRNRLQNLTVPPGLTKYQREKREKTAAMIIDILNNSKHTDVNIFKDIKYNLISKKLSLIKKEHDIIFVKPHHKTIGQIEVKAKDQKNGEVLKALEQLEGGRQEMLRTHGHLLDYEWSYLGVICLPNLPQNLKPPMCRRLCICNNCAEYILVGDVRTEMKLLMEKHFMLKNTFLDEAVWRTQNKELVSRILAMEHLSLHHSTVRRITGSDSEVSASFTKGSILLLVNLSC